MSREVIELVPIPPDTVESVQAEVESAITEALKKNGKESLLNDGDISVDVEETFPTADAVHVAFTLLSGIALETFKQIILPWLKTRYEVRRKKADGGD